MNGVIKRLVTPKGFGFILGDDQVEYFFHKEAVSGGDRFDRLTEGQAVTFQPQSGPKGPRAGSVATV